MNLKVGRVTPCAPQLATHPLNDAHGVTSPTNPRRSWPCCPFADRGFLLTSAATVFKHALSQINRFAAFIIGTVVVVCPVLAAEVKFTLPPENNRFKSGPGSEIAAAQCVICHSVDYISTQPPMPRAFWKAGVQKMQKVYGAPIPDSEVDRLVDYLARNYGDEKPRNTSSPTTVTPGK